MEQRAGANLHIWIWIFHPSHHGYPRKCVMGQRNEKGIGAGSVISSLQLIQSNLSIFHCVLAICDLSRWTRTGNWHMCGKEAAHTDTEAMQGNQTDVPFTGPNANWWFQRELIGTFSSLYNRYLTNQGAEVVEMKKNETEGKLICLIGFLVNHGRRERRRQPQSQNWLVNSPFLSEMLCWPMNHAFFHHAFFFFF